jgi:hypothetical protein
MEEEAVKHPIFCDLLVFGASLAVAAAVADVAPASLLLTH